MFFLVQVWASAVDYACCVIIGLGGPYGHGCSQSRIRSWFSPFRNALFHYDGLAVIPSASVVRKQIQPYFIPSIGTFF